MLRPRNFATGRALRLATASALLVLAASCSRTSSPPASPTPSVTSIAVEGSAPAVGATSQLKATATLSDGTTQIVTNQATWRSSNASIVTISATGVATGIAAGDVEITASYSGVTGTARLAVRTPSAQSVTLSGMLVDDRVGSGLRDGTVAIVEGPDAGRTVTADASGNYTLPDLARGTIRVRGGAAGYDSLDETVTLTADTRMDFKLHQVPVPCAYTLSPISSPDVPPSGGQQSIAVNRTTGGCSWQAVSNAGWISFAGATSASNSGAFAYRVDTNSGGDRRTGTIAVQWSGGSAQVSVTQQADNECSYFFVPPEVYASGPGRFSANFIAGINTRCTWQARPDAAWLSVAGTASGTGAGTLTYDAAANATGAERVGTITLVHDGARTAALRVTQAAAGSGCSFGVSPLSIGVSRGGFASPSSIAITTGAGCAWTAAADWTFIKLIGDPTFVHSVSSSGSGTVSVGANASTCHRTDRVRIRWTGGGVDVVVDQASTDPPCTP